MEKKVLSIVKMMEKETRKSSPGFLKYAIVESDTMYLSNFDTTIEIKDCGVPDGIYNLAELAKGLVVDRRIIERSDIPNYTENYKELPYLYCISVKDDMKSMAKFVRKGSDILSGVYLTNEGAISTNSHWGKYTTNKMDSQEIIISQLLCSTLSIISTGVIRLEVYGRKDEKTKLTTAEYIKFYVDNIVVYSNVMSGKYPNFPACIPSEIKEEITLTKEHYKTLKDLKKLGYKSIIYIDDILYASKSTNCTNCDTISTRFTIPTDVVFAFNLNYLVGILDDADTVDINVRFVSDKLPYIFNNMYLLMPLRVVTLTYSGSTVTM